MPRWTFHVCLLLVLAFGCSKSADSPAPLTEDAPSSAAVRPALEALGARALYLADATSPNDRPVELEERAARALKALYEGGRGLLPWAPDRRPQDGGVDVRVALYYALLVGDEIRNDADAGTAWVSVEGEVELLGSDGLSERVTATLSREVPFERATQDAGEVWGGLAERLLQELQRELDAGIRLLYLDDDAVIERLAQGSGAERSMAVGEAVRRKLAAAAPVFVAWLGAEGQDPHQTRAAIEALGALRAATAVPALVEVARQNDPDVVLHVVRALQAIGGPDAREGLEFLAATHVLPTVREAARAALGAPSGPPPTPRSDPR
jgi:hypothetical protein